MGMVGGPRPQLGMQLPQQQQQQAPFNSTGGGAAPPPSSITGMPMSQFVNAAAAGPPQEQGQQPGRPGGPPQGMQQQQQLFPQQQQQQPFPQQQPQMQQGGPPMAGPPMMPQQQQQLGPGQRLPSAGPLTMPGMHQQHPQQQQPPMGMMMQQPQQQQAGPPQEGGFPGMQHQQQFQSQLHQHPQMPGQGLAPPQQQQMQQPMGYPGQQMGFPGQQMQAPQAVPAMHSASSARPAGGSGSAAPRIDPNQIPRPRYTNPANPVRYNTTDSSANVPPPAWADFVAEDTGNANPRFMRSTLGHVPTSKDILKESKLPLAVLVTPLAQPLVSAGERPLQCVDFGEEGPIRCGRCRGYINSWAKWSVADGGRTWSCNLCGMNNEAPGWYQCSSGVDQYGNRRDRNDRPELCVGSLEFTAPKAYLLRPPSPLCVAFLVDTSLPAITSGQMSTVLVAIKAALETLQYVGGGKARAGIVTFDSSVQFYDCSPGRKDVMQAVAGDIDDSFCPLPLDQWCPPVSQAKQQLDALLTRLPVLFQPTIARSSQSCSGAAIKAAVDGLGDTGGRIIAFECQLPLIGEGKLGNREAAKNYGIDKERDMYTPASGPAGQWYIDLAKHAASRGIAVDIAACSSSNFVDLPTQAALTTHTGGEVVQYPYFTPSPAVPSPSQPVVPIQPVPDDVQEKIGQEVREKRARERERAYYWCSCCCCRRAQWPRRC